jgi:hypothetical protein
MHCSTIRRMWSGTGASFRCISAWQARKDLKIRFSLRPHFCFDPVDVYGRDVGLHAAAGDLSGAHPAVAPFIASDDEAVIVEIEVWKADPVQPVVLRVVHVHRLRRVCVTRSHLRPKFPGLTTYVFSLFLCILGHFAFLLVSLAPHPPPMATKLVVQFTRADSLARRFRSTRSVQLSKSAQSKHNPYR